MWSETNLREGAVRRVRWPCRFLQTDDGDGDEVDAAAASQRRARGFNWKRDSSTRSEKHMSQKSKERQRKEV